MKRSTLIVMQVAGALTLLAYPMVLLASVMTLGAATEADAGAGRTLQTIASVGLMLYPAIWVLLWVGSWMAFKQGRSRLAALLSTPPLLVLALLAGAMGFSGAYAGWIGHSYAANQAKEFERVEKLNPLLAAAMRFENDDVSWSSLETAIRSADPWQLSSPVRLLPVEIPGMTVTRNPDAPPDPIVMRTPLGYLLERTHMGPGPDYDVADARPHFAAAARLMIARGATLAPPEIEHNPELPRLLHAITQGTPPPGRP